MGWASFFRLRDAIQSVATSFFEVSKRKKLNLLLVFAKVGKHKFCFEKLVLFFLWMVSFELERFRHTWNSFRDDWGAFTGGKTRKFGRPGRR